VLIYWHCTDLYSVLWARYRPVGKYNSSSGKICLFFKSLWLSLMLALLLHFSIRLRDRLSPCPRHNFYLTMLNCLDLLLRYKNFVSLLISEFVTQNFNLFFRIVCFVCSYFIFSLHKYMYLYNMWTILCILVMNSFKLLVLLKWYNPSSLSSKIDKI
jgi:hypothetical protein